MESEDSISTLYNWMDSLPLYSYDMIEEAGEELEDPRKLNRLYRCAHQRARKLRKSNPQLLPLHNFEDFARTPLDGLMSIKEWCERHIDTMSTKGSHSNDFRSAHWYGTDYTFTPMQAAAVKILWEAWGNGTPEMGQEYILVNIDSDSKHLKDIFKGNSAWKTIIVAGRTAGSFRLKKPENS